MLDQEPTDYPAWWHEMGVITAVELGGSAHRVRPDYGVESAPGTVGFEMRRTTRPLLRPEYIALIGERLVELVSSGLNEAFLIRSLVQHLDDYVDSMTDVSAIKERRQGERQRFESALESATTDEAEAYERMAKMMRDVSPEDEVGRWALGDRWEKASAALTKGRIETWEGRRAARFLG